MRAPGPPSPTPVSAPIRPPSRTPARTPVADAPGSPLAQVRALARLLDDAIRVPGTGIGIGLDGLLGLIPGVGDAAGGLVSAYLVLQAARMGVSRSVLARMLVNVGIDALVGAVPLLGDIFDFAWKANRKNAQLLEAAVAAPDATRRASTGVVVGAVVAIALMVGGGILLTILVMRWLAQQL